MNIFKKLFEKLSLTRTEIRIFLLLGSVLLIGSGYKLLFRSEKNSSYKKMDYSAEDSLFKAVVANEPSEGATPVSEADYKEEVLELNKSEFKSSEKVIPSEHSININTAGIEELSSLPGIGEKTAQLIIDFRKSKGRINKLEELIDIKGIGESKLNRIKNYLIID